MGWIGLLRGSSTIISYQTIRQSAYDILLDYNISCASILYRFHIIESYLSNAANFEHQVGWPGWISLRSLVSENNYSPWALVQQCLCDHMFSHFSRTVTCDRWTDRHNDSIYHARIAQHRMVKTGKNLAIVNLNIKNSTVLNKVSHGEEVCTPCWWHFSGTYLWCRHLANAVEAAVASGGYTAMLASGFDFPHY